MRRVLMSAIAFAALVCAPAAYAEQAPSGEIANAKKQIDMTVAQMSALSFHIREDLRITRKRGTKAQITCVDQALSQADVATRHARETGDQTLEAYGRGDIEIARASLRRVFELRELGRLASMAANTCSAAHVVVQTATTVTMTEPNAH